MIRQTTLVWHEPQEKPEPISGEQQYLLRVRTTFPDGGVWEEYTTGYFYEGDFMDKDFMMIASANVEILRWAEITDEEWQRK